MLKFLFQPLKSRKDAKEAGFLGGLADEAAPVPLAGRACVWHANTTAGMSMPGARYGSGLNFSGYGITVFIAGLVPHLWRTIMLEGIIY
jgi:hypothetical protein